MVTSMDLKTKSKELEKKYNLSHYEVLQRFMFERILERISVSNYLKFVKNIFREFRVRCSFIMSKIVLLISL